MVKPIHKRGLFLNILDIVLLYGIAPIAIFAAIGGVFMVGYLSAVEEGIDMNLEADVELTDSEIEQLWVFTQIMPYYLIIWTLATVLRLGGLLQLILYGSPKCIHCQKRVNVVYGKDKTKYHDCKNCGIYPEGR